MKLKKIRFFVKSFHTTFISLPNVSSIDKRLTRELCQCARIVTAGCGRASTFRIAETNSRFEASFLFQTLAIHRTSTTCDAYDYPQVICIACVCTSLCVICRSMCETDRKKRGEIGRKNKTKETNETRRNNCNLETKHNGINEWGRWMKESGGHMCERVVCAQCADMLLHEMLFFVCSSFVSFIPIVRPSSAQRALWQLETIHSDEASGVNTFELTYSIIQYPLRSVSLIFRPLARV